MTCDPGETGTYLPCVFWGETCLLWAGIWTSSSEETLTSSWAGSVSEAGFSARERGPQSPPDRQSGLRPCASAHSWRPPSFQTRCRRNLNNRIMNGHITSKKDLEATRDTFISVSLSLNKPLLSHGLILSLPNSISLILPKVEKISWRCSLFTFLVKRPMWIFVEGGDPLRARPLGPDLDLERSRGFSGAAWKQILLLYTLNLCILPTLTLGLSSLVLLSFLTGEEAGSFPALGALALSLPLFFFLSFFVLSLLLDLTKKVHISDCLTISVNYRTCWSRNWSRYWTLSLSHC